MLSGIESGATADMTGNEILTAVKTVDGTGSGWDAVRWTDTKPLTLPLTATSFTIRETKR
jgi:hypothetical protein